MIKPTENYFNVVIVIFMCEDATLITWVKLAIDAFGYDPVYGISLDAQGHRSGNSEGISIVELSDRPH